jgi:peroxiredoxin
MPVIYCAVDMFALSQAIRLVDDNGVTTTIYATSNDLPATIASLCKEKNITDVHLYGNANYLNEIATTINTTYNLNYHRGNPLNIEVN